MPPDHGVGRDYDQVLPPVAAPAADKDPQQRVEPPKADPPLLPGGTREHGPLVAQQKVLGDQVTAPPFEPEIIRAYDRLWAMQLPPNERIAALEQLIALALAAAPSTSSGQQE